MNDLIHKQDVLALAKDVILINGAKHRCIDATQIHELPSAERIGHWIELYENNYQCSECNAWWTCEDTPIASGMNFCPNCGARMVSEDVDYN